jgi:hypothetical protein
VDASNGSNIGIYSSQSSTGKLGAKEDSCQLLREAWLLKNSIRKWQKTLCVRKPYQRLSRFAKIFSIPQISAVLRKMDFFKSHRRAL